MKNINIRSMSLSTILTFVLIVFMTIYSELNAKFKDFLVGLMGHHWVSKGIISLVFFVVVYFVLDKFISKKEDVKGLVHWVIIFTILGSLAIFIFYLYEFFV